MENKTFKIRPYARLLTMLGEQLIKNEQIALAELIKNAYDADADWVKVSFVGFGEKMEILPDSKIIIEDNGCGMSLETIEKSWMNPATPNKKAKVGEEKRSRKGRVIQGEKGIGRFAILKLGRKIMITTRQKDSNEEYVIDYDLSVYDDDFLSVGGEEKELYIDDIAINVYTQQATQIADRVVTVNSQKFSVNNHSGTKIEISNLKGEWSQKKVEDVDKDSRKLQSIFDKIFGKQTNDDFEIGFEINNERVRISDKTIEQLSNLLENNAVIKITEGKYNEKEQRFEFKINDVIQKLELSDRNIAGLSVFKNRFISPDLFGSPEIRKSDCGNFSFNFFIFDLDAKKESSQYCLDKNEAKIIKDHRIYLYRDKIRVAPYGDSNDDWLKIDVLRGTARAGDYLSNDQVVGFVEISKKENSRLKDKTNREGLIEEGNSTEDFIVLIQTFLKYIRQYPYDRYKQDKEQEEAKRNNPQIIEHKIEELKEDIIKTSSNPKKTLEKYNEVRDSYKKAQEFYQNKIATTTDLAGVGLSVETASHDMMMMMTKGMTAIDNLIKDTKGHILKESEIIDTLLKVKDMFVFVENQIKNIQLLFKSSKQRRRDIQVINAVDQVKNIYKRSLEREQIELKINQNGLPVVAKCTDAVLLQLLINLFDNAVYWLNIPHANVQNKKIQITLNGDTQKLVFSDNGPGIKDDDKPYVFEAFYSGKEEGRGLGLYIARQLLNRMEYSIDLAKNSSENILSGANFVVNFNKSNKNE
jgi:C4-dicarboxylate-specific signal transduction histidine kinase